VDAETDFLPIQSLDIEAEKTISFNLYVNLPLNQRYVLYRRAGAVIENERLAKLAGQNVSQFFIEKKDYRQFISYVAQRLQELVGSSLTVENKRFMLAAARAVLSSTINQTDPAIAQVLMENLNEITVTLIEGMLDHSHPQRKLFSRFAALAEKGTDYQKHPVNVASLAVLLTFGIGYSSERTLTDMAIAGLLHDIGLSKLPPKVIAGAHYPLDLDVTDRALVYKHPAITVRMLEERQIPISNLAKTVILQHHEQYNGSGYPNGLRGFGINELAQILRVADDLDLLISHFQNRAGSLKLQVMEHFDYLSEQKVIEPMLLGRIRHVLI
jgi:HD-GYP domain-containing protein (c-di-GMP phosphodiesterase class II)